MGVFLFTLESLSAALNRIFLKKKNLEKKKIILFEHSTCHKSAIKCLMLLFQRDNSNFLMIKSQFTEIKN